jgi:DNA-binding MarR family transcriptional regulator
MVSLSPSLRLLMNMAVAHAIVTRRLDARLGGLSFTEFLILFHLDRTPEGKMRRIDLAEQIGLTASGVTRLLAPMEKIGLIKREANAQDARVSYVAIDKSGKRMLKESIENAEELAHTLLELSAKSDIESASNLLQKLGGTVR